MLTVQHFALSQITGVLDHVVKTVFATSAGPALVQYGYLRPCLCSSGFWQPILVFGVLRFSLVDNPKRTWPQASLVRMCPIPPN